MRYKPREVRKFLVAAATALSEALALGLLSHPADKYAMVVLSALGAYGVWKVPNGEKVAA